MNRIFYPAFEDLGERKKGDPVALEIPVDSGEISDGYHSFNELYEHRCLLFCVLLTIAAHEDNRPMGWDMSSWRSQSHHDGSEIEGWFIAGIDFHGHAEPITYHLPERMWDLLRDVPVLDKAPEWDGHTSLDVIERLKEWLKT